MTVMAIRMHRGDRWSSISKSTTSRTAAYLSWLHHWGNDGDKYAAMLKAVYPAIKAANPNAKVVLGGIAYEGSSRTVKVVL